jgi:hypothetical protein
VQKLARKTMRWEINFLQIIRDYLFVEKAAGNKWYLCLSAHK